MKISHPIPPGTSIRFKKTGQKELVSGTVVEPKLFGSRTWMYSVDVGGALWGVSGAQIVEEFGRVDRGEDGWGT